jgi:uncharacterized protein YxjI
MQPKLYIDQKITAFVNKYVIYEANGEERGTITGLAQQKRLAFKEKVNFYTSEAKDELSFSFRAEKVFDVHGRYFVEDQNGQLLGMFRKNFKKSLINSTWHVMDKDGTEVFVIRESSTILGVLRRTVGFIPYVGDLLSLIIILFKYHFIFTDATTGEAVGRYQKMTLFRDHYQLSMTDEAFARVDERVLAAMGVGLDALQSR